MFGENDTRIYMHWQDILTIIVPLAGFLAWVYSRMDKRFDEIKATFGKVDERFNSQEEGMNKRFHRLEESMNERFNRVDERFNRVDERFHRLEKDFAQLSTRVAVIESKMSDLNTNVTYLMWQHQIPPLKEAQE